MIRWTELGTAAVPGGGELRLMRRGGEYAIFAGPTELMNSRVSGSETALAALTCAGLPPGARVLIGGLGMGFTLRAALERLGADARVTLAELVPEVVDWARGPLAGLHGASLDDPRVALVIGDVGGLLAAPPGPWDAILLDVDNGPAGLTRSGNDQLYDAYGLGEAFRSLRPGGVLAVWSAVQDAAFARRLAAVGFAVEERRVRADGRGGGARHIIWLAVRPL